ncbi:unnamed protein product [Ilex paraguariensis]|uniref:Anaphase-promoting complex subunit 1 N-terminal domain-containing protein n=1 Tax=Ilex paraguariensis TaxID=185542 RepID=A0ABC8TRP7_9AQUA
MTKQAVEGNLTTHVPFPPSSPLSSARDIFRPKRDIGYSPQHSYSSLSAFDYNIKGDAASMPSHLILKDPLEEPQDPLEEPQLIYIEERGKASIMREFDEKTIWTSDCIPLMASFNKGKMQHSLWVAEVVDCNLEVANSKLSDVVPPGVLPKQCSFRRIWQGKGAQTAARYVLGHPLPTMLHAYCCVPFHFQHLTFTRFYDTCPTSENLSVFLATDDDTAPIICFLLQERKKLLSVRLQSVEINNEILYDIKPDMSWSVPAVVAAPVIVTRPRVKVGLLPCVDIMALTSENSLLLYSGKQCLCRYTLPSVLGKGQALRTLKSSEIASALLDVKIVGLADAVEGRVNVILTNGQIYRCTLRRRPSSSLANDCITTMAEGLTSSFFNHFLVLLWGDGDSAYLAQADSGVDSEWESFCSIIMQMCRKSRHVPRRSSNSVSHSSWEFLINSSFHKNYCKQKFIPEISPRMSLDLQGSDSSGSFLHGIQSPTELFMETLDSLHGLYESLKLDNLRKR